MSHRYSSYGGFAPYVPVAERRAKAKRQTDKLRKKGRDIQPIEIEGRTIARSFWGKGWCSHLESFGDYSNRLPRGRTYVRNGSVCHLGIKKGKVEAMVSGSGLYNVKVDIKPLNPSKWIKLKKECTGKIGSLIELLQGKLSDEIMGTVTDRTNGLFPQTGEISYKCDCPDSASMCKHISAVMYGIGARLDSQPELLFLLRGVDHSELISADVSEDAIGGKGTRRRRRRSLSGKDLENVFGVELDQNEDALTMVPKRRSTRKAGSRKKTPFIATGRKIANLRRRKSMTIAEFAKDIGVSGQTVKKWEKSKGAIKPRAKGMLGLTRLFNS